MHMTTMRNANTAITVVSILNELDKNPKNILFGFQPDELNDFTLVIAFKFETEWSVLPNSQLSFAREARYLEMREIFNALWTYQKDSGVPLLISDQILPDLSHASSEQALEALKRHCVRDYDQSGTKDMLEKQTIVKSLFVYYPLGTDLLVFTDSHQSY